MSGCEDGLTVTCTPADAGRLDVEAEAFRLCGWPVIVADGAPLALTAARLTESAGKAPGADPQAVEPQAAVRLRPKQPLTVHYRFGDRAELTLALSADAGVRIEARLANLGQTALVLGKVELLRTRPGAPACRLGSSPAAVASLEQGNYWGRVRPLDVDPEACRTSDLVWVAYDRQRRGALLAGWLSSQRWLGQIRLEQPGRPEAAVAGLGFDGGDLVVEPQTEVELEQLLLSAGPDPWALLEQYAAAVARRWSPQFPSMPPVTWCSWYPYRLGVSEERVLAEARMAASRLRPLGLTAMVVDLGWQSGNLPSTFDENERFAHGLGWLAAQLGELGLQLGVWTALFSISAQDPVAREHPEWLVQGEDGKPARHSDWYWEPHGDVYVLDLTHPEAVGLVARRIGSLRARGVRYLKADFIGCVSAAMAKRRHDPRQVGGGGVEAARSAAAVIRRQLPDALLLNCGGPEMPGTGHWPLLYTCNDTGNTGYIKARFQQENHQTLSCHLFKNGRWGVIQPSCLCVGLPGDLEEARLRATAAFLAGGQIDISDALTTLAEDRWAVLAATLPPLGHSARPLDLFEPIDDGGGFAYVTTSHGEDAVAAQPRLHPPGSVWLLHVDGGWDEWDLLAVFSFTGQGVDQEPAISRFALPLERLGWSAADVPHAFEFWAGQYLGRADVGRTNAGGYAHPGDMQDLLCARAPGCLELAFFGPAAKLVRLWRPRPHPWIAGTSFHQSCGGELRDVRWDAAAGLLSGRIDRPPGERGQLTLSGCSGLQVDAAADGRPVLTRPGAHGSVVVAIEVTHPGMEWAVRCRPRPE